MIISGVHSFFCFMRGSTQSGPDAMSNAGGIGDDQGGTRIGSSFRQCFYCLVVIGSHGNLGHIYISICHGNGCQIFFSAFLAACGKFCGRAQGSCFGCLSACIGVNFRIQYQDIDIPSTGKDMIQTAESYIICPAVSAHDPLDGVRGISMLFCHILSHEHSVTKFGRIFKKGI